MKGIWLVVLLFMAATWLSPGMSFGAEEKGLTAPEAEIVITGEKKSAKFSHQVHLDLGVACGQCHHDSKHEPLTEKDIAVMENGQQLSCVSCHNADFANTTLQSRKDVFHARCRECHKQGVNGKTGPSKCTACHVK